MAKKKRGSVKRFSTILAAAMILFPLSAGSAVVGDVDGDGKIDLSEAIYALQVAAGHYPSVSTSCQLAGEGDWVAATSYLECDVVEEGGSYYICTANHTSSTNFASDSANWTLLALQASWNKNGSDINYSDGNVSIGTTVPDTKLTIQNAVYGDYALNVGGTNNAKMKVRHIDGKADDSAEIGELYLQYDNNHNTYLNAESAGNVGIGTTSPDTKLTIQNSIPGDWALNVGGTNNARMKVRHIDGKHESSAETGDLFLQYDLDHNTYLNVGSTGSVGIGTNSPAGGYKLDVEGLVQANGFDTGDITFRKNGEILWRMFEDDEGLYLENFKTKKVFRLVLQELGENSHSMAQLQWKNQELEKRVVRLESLLSKE